MKITYKYDHVVPSYTLEEDETKELETAGFIEIDGHVFTLNNGEITHYSLDAAFDGIRLTRN